MIGPVDSQCARALCKGEREIRLPASADEVRIFFNLAMNRAHYSPANSAIYFVDSHHVAVEEILRAAFTGMALAFRMDQLYLDELSIFKSVKRVTLTPDKAPTVLVALRIEGIQVTRSI